NGLVDGTSYHWQHRSIDRTGRVTAWHAFGGNPETAPDVRVAVAATRLSFRQEPTTTTAGSPISPAIEVTAVDGSGQLIAGYTGTVTLRILDNPGGGTLSGDRSVSAVGGVAT